MRVVMSPRRASTYILRDVLNSIPEEHIFFDTTKCDSVIINDDLFFLSDAFY